MIKNFKYMFAAAALMVATASCQEDAEDAFSKAPAAPTLAENSTILLTQNTMSESVTWAWTAARFTEGAVSYQLKGTYDDKTLNVGPSTDKLTTTLSKTDFKSVADQFGAPSNSSFTIKMYVTATDAVGSYDSDPITVTVYSYGDAVAAVVTAAANEIILDMENPDGEVALLTWEAARLGYNEDILYSVVASYQDGATVELASKLTECTYTTTVDALNEAAVAAGAPEEEAAAVDFQVIASSASIEALPSAKAPITITTYKATYPDKLYLPGSYQGWDPASAVTIPQSTLTKGLFEAIVDLSTEDGSDVQFKFSPNPAWEGDFGSDDLAVSSDLGFAVAAGTTVGSGNLSVPSGMYRVACDMKHKTVELVQVTSISMIGGFNGWGADVDMEYDPTMQAFVGTTTMSEGDEYKFRFNHDWTYSIGDNGAISGGENFVMDKESGEYRFVLSVGSHPYGVKVLSTSFPVCLYLPGSYQGWSPATAPTLQGNGEGVFEGGVLLGTEGETQFKFSPNPEWKDDFGCDNLVCGENGVYTGTYGAGDNLVVAAGYYYITVDMTTASVKLEPINSLGIIGGFPQDGWGNDVAKLSYDADNNVWTGSCQINAGVEWKIRANDAWDWNRGGSLMALGTPFDGIANGANIQVPEDGTFTISVDLSVNPNKIVVKK